MMPASSRCSRSVARASSGRQSPVAISGRAGVPSSRRSAASVSATSSHGQDGSVAGVTSRRSPVWPIRHRSGRPASNRSGTPPPATLPRLRAAATPPPDAATFALRFEVDATSVGCRREVVEQGGHESRGLAALLAVEPSSDLVPTNFGRATTEGTSQGYVGGRKAPATVPGPTGRTSGDGRSDTLGDDIHDRHDRTV